MSKRESVTITCPACGRDSEFTVWHSINTVIDPDMKDAFRDGTAFIFRCPDCGNETPVFYPCLYHQMEDNIMIYLVDEGSAESACNSFDIPEAGGILTADDFKQEYLLRVVTSVNALMEKIRIFDSGRDDRAVEIYKELLLENLKETRPDFDVARIIFDTADDGDFFVIIGNDGNAASTDLDENFYEGIEAVLLRDGGARDEEEKIIDSEWARRMLE